MKMKCVGFLNTMLHAKSEMKKGNALRGVKKDKASERK